MPLQWQKIEVPMGVGIDEQAHRFVTAPPNLAYLLNGRIDKDGQINCRPGYDALPAAPGTPEKLLKFRERLYTSYFDASGGTNNNVLALAALNDDENRWDAQGGGAITNALTECTIDGRDTIARPQTGSFSVPDISLYATGRLAVLAWVGYSVKFTVGAFLTRIFAVVIDMDTLATVTPIQEISTGANAAHHCDAVRIVQEGTTAHVLYVDTDVGHIRSKSYDLSARTWGSDTALFTDAATVPVIDAYEATSSAWVLAYGTAAGKVSVSTMSGNASTGTVLINEAPRAVGVCVDATVSGNNIWLAWCKTAGPVMRYAVYDLSLAVKVAVANLDATITEPATKIGLCLISNAKVFIAYTLEAPAAAPATTSRPLTKFITATNGGVLGTIRSRRSISLESRPFVQSGHVYGICGYRGYIDGPIPSLACYATVAFCGFSAVSNASVETTFRPCAIWAQGVAAPPSSGHNSQGFVVPQCPIWTDPDGNTDGQYWTTDCVVQSVKNGGVDANDNPRIFQDTGVDLLRFDLRAEDRTRAVEFGRHLFITGGHTVVFDGMRLMEHGYYWPPEDAVGTAGGVGFLSTGSYQVAIVWELRLASGAVMRSQPILATDGSGSTTFAVTAGQKIALELPPLNLTQKYNAILNTTNAEFFQAATAVVYRTEANGEVFYRETEIPAALSVMINDAMGSGPMVFDITTADADVLASEQLYTSGGALPAWPMPPCDDFVVYKNRLFGIPSEDKKALAYTQFLSDGEVPMWHPFLELRLDDDGENVGLATMDDNLIVFKQNAVWIVRGNGPDRKGLNSDYVMTRLNVPYGCTNRRTIVTDQRGVFFQSSRGLMRITRSLECEFPGDKVIDETSSDFTIRAATALPAYTDRLYFALSGENEGKFLVYQWNNDQWAVDTVLSDEEGTIVPISAVYLDRTEKYYVIFSGSSTPFVHTGDQDPHDTYELAVLTPWFQFSGHQGFKRIRAMELMGEYFDDHELHIDVYKNYDDTSVTPVQSVEWSTNTETPLTVFGVLNRYQFKVHIADQRVESMRFFIRVVPTPNDSFHSNCAAFTGMAFDVGIKPTMMRLPSVAMRG